MTDEVGTVVEEDDYQELKQLSKLMKLVNKMGELEEEKEEKKPDLFTEFSQLQQQAFKIPDSVIKLQSK